jgi:transcriptional regulator with GAF, ATPase, and Fis domain
LVRADLEGDMNNVTDHEAGDAGGAGGAVDLAAAMAAAALVLKEPETVEDALARLVVVALSVIPGAEQCGISVADRKSVTTVASTDGMVDRLDQLQYDLDEGPCLDAMRHHTSVVVDDMRTETRWPRFAPPAAEAGCISQMGLEIFRESGRVGGLNLYSTRPSAFDDQTRQAATLLAIHTSVVMGKVIAVDNLHHALRTRQLIGQAVGIVMYRYAVDEQAAFAYLARTSQNSNVKLHEVAAKIVADTAIGTFRDPGHAR